LGAGVGLLLAPGLGAQALGRPGARSLSRALGVRDLVLASAALASEPGTRAWRVAVACGAAADGFDAVLCVRGGRGAMRLPTIAAALGGAAAGGYLAARVSPAVPFVA
jgi:hypothetical protein